MAKEEKKKWLRQVKCFYFFSLSLAKPRKDIFLTMDRLDHDEVKSGQAMVKSALKRSNFFYFFMELNHKTLDY
jgi:hypothetical protein